MQKIEINLSKKTARKTTLLNVTAAAAAFLALTLSWHNTDSYLKNRKGIARADERISALKERLPGRGKPGESQRAETDLKLLKKDVEYINGIISRKTFSWSELLWSLETSTPAGVRLVQISPDFLQSSVAITGSATNMGDVLLMVDSMNRSNAFTSAFLLKHSEERGGMIIFNISSRFAPGKKL